MRQFSFWEKDQYRLHDSIVIVGGGICGISTAIEIMKADPTASVVVIDRSFPPHGASTKNAGFVCFGSISEIIDDLKQSSKEEVTEVIRLRWEGGKRLLDRIQPNRVKYSNTGGIECFDEGASPTQDEIELCNDIMLQATGNSNYFSRHDLKGRHGFGSDAIHTPYEGMIQPALMMQELYKIANGLGVKFLNAEVKKIDPASGEIHFTDNQSTTAHHTVITTNGFAAQMIDIEDLRPARNLVLMTKPVVDLQWKGTYHYDEGYYYFRDYEGRLLLGGARNMDPDVETTSSFGINTKVQDELTRFLRDVLKVDSEIDYWWSGILGIGNSKHPIIKKHSDKISIGVRLGGMGVAIGSELGRQLAKFALR